MYPWQAFILGLCEHLAWPILVGGCIIYYRKDIRRMLARMTKLPLGAELTPETAEKQQEDKEIFDNKFKKTMEEQQKAKDEFDKAMTPKISPQRSREGKK